MRLPNLTNFKMDGKLVTRLSLATIINLFSIILFYSPGYTWDGDTKESISTRFREPNLVEKFDRLDDMLFWGELDPKGKKYEFWGYQGVVNMNGYGAPAKTIVFDENRMVVFMVLCGPRVYRCQWELQETLPKELHDVTPKVINKKQLEQKGWANERANFILIWETNDLYMEAVITDLNSEAILKSKTIGTVKTIPEMLLRSKPSSIK